jgi:rare lipoprotein A
MTKRIAVLAMMVVLVYGCAATAPQPELLPEMLRGIASWYGEEFAGRTTANGEIFDPQQLTAAHRTFPFGTVLDVTNTNTQQTVRVRVNDRGPYIGGRILDLSYAAAQQIGLIEPGVGPVQIAVVKVGSGDREPPVPFEATVATTVAEAPKSVPIVKKEEPPPVEPIIVSRVEVQTERAGMVTRTQVGADGRTLEEVPVRPADPAPSAASLDRSAARQTAAAPKPAAPPPTRASTRKQFIVQVGAFSVEANAKLLKERLVAIGQPAWIDRENLYRVRIGPFATRDEAADTRAALEAKGMSAIIVSE